MVDFLDRLPGLALEWLPIVFFGLLVYLVWRTMQFMPRVKPQALQPRSKWSPNPCPIGRAGARRSWRACSASTRDASVIPIAAA